MSGFIKKHWKKIFISALAVLFVLQFSSTVFAQEQDQSLLDKAGSLLPWNIGKTVTSKVTEAVLEAATMPITMMTWLARIMGGFILAQVTFVLGFVVDLNFNILNTELATYKFIGVGWGIMRDIANLGFVLFIILIALATIIRYQEYEAKKLLPRLIMVAILVNFSLAIPTVFLNFSNILTHYFLDRIGDPSAEGLDGAGGSVRFAYELVTIFKPQNFIITNPSAEDIAVLAGPALGVGEGMLNFASSMTARFMNMIFLVLAILVIGTLAILFMVRFIMLSFLLVLGPVAWLTWVIPGLENNFKSWWKKFIQHTFFMPISIFFIYLVILTGDGFYAIAQNRETDLFTAEGISNIFKQQLMYGSAMLIISGFMLGAIFVGKKLSIEGAGKALNIGKSWSDKARKWAGKKTVEGGKRAVASDRGLAIAKRLTQNRITAPIGNYLQGVGFGKLAADKKAAEEKLFKQSGGDYREIERIGESAWRPSIRNAARGLIDKKDEELQKEVNKKRDELKIAQAEVARAEGHNPGQESDWEASSRQYNEFVASKESEKSELQRRLDASSDIAERQRIRTEMGAIDEEVRKHRKTYNEEKSKVDTARGKEKIASEEYNKALAAMQHFNEDVLSKMPADFRQALKGVRINLPEDKKFQPQYAPETSFKKLNQQIENLNEEVRKNQNLNDRKQADPLASKEQKDEAYGNLQRSMRLRDTVQERVQNYKDKHSAHVENLRSAIRLKQEGGSDTELAEASLRVRESKQELEEAKKTLPVVKPPTYGAYDPKKEERKGKRE